MSYTSSKDRHLDELKQEHKDLNELIDDPNSNQHLSEFTIQKLKKRKLLLKDKINNLSTKLYPDIIA